MFVRIESCELGDLDRADYLARRQALQADLAELAPEPLPTLATPSACSTTSGSSVGRRKTPKRTPAASARVRARSGLTAAKAGRPRARRLLSSRARRSGHFGPSSGTSRPEGSIKGSTPTTRCERCKYSRKESPGYAGLLQSPLTDSNRRPPPYQRDRDQRVSPRSGFDCPSCAPAGASAADARGWHRRSGAKRRPSAQPPGRTPPDVRAVSTDDVQAAAAKGRATYMHFR